MMCIDIDGTELCIQVVYEPYEANITYLEHRYNGDPGADTRGWAKFLGGIPDGTAKTILERLWYPLY